MAVDVYVMAVCMAYTLYHSLFMEKALMCSLYS